MAKHSPHKAGDEDSNSSLVTNLDEIIQEWKSLSGPPIYRWYIESPKGVLSHSPWKKKTEISDVDMIAHFHNDTGYITVRNGTKIRCTECNAIVPDQIRMMARLQKLK